MSVRRTWKIKMNKVKVGSIIKLFKKYYKHGEPGSAITKDHVVIYGEGLKLRVYAIEHATVEHLQETMRSKILRCRSEEGKPMVIVCKIDSYEVI